MSSFNVPVLNGITPSWADIQVRASIDGGELITMGDIQAINTGVTVEVGKQKEGGRLIKRTTGDVTDEATWTLYAAGWTKLLKALKSKATQRNGQFLVGLVHFQVHMIWTPPGSDDVLEQKIKGCRILGRSIDSAEGTDAQLIEVPLSPAQIVDVIDGDEVVMI